MIYVIDAISNKKVPAKDTQKVIVYMDDWHIEFGYTKNHKGLPIYLFNGIKYPILMKMNNIVYCKRTGEFVVDEEGNPYIEYDKNVYGNGRFPYEIAREYGAEKHINMFNESIIEVENVEYPYAKHLKYSFGLEFETAAGFIPEQKCFNLGLIPLRDGSISGIEYSTIPLSGNEGLNRLKAQLECLKEYTIPNKECSVHIHFGGFPINKKSIFALHQLWSFKYQHLLRDYIPNYSYNTNYFKNNGKNYCAETPCFKDFKSMYQYYVGCNFMGDLYQPHPNDVEKKAKWNIKTRYFNCNFINLLCYRGPKTLEFRFLTPTYSFEKLTTFIMIFNALLIEAEHVAEFSERNLNDIIMDKDKSLKERISDVYPSNIAKKVIDNLEKLRYLRATQENCGDNCGSRLDIEYKYFPDGQ